MGFDFQTVQKLFCQLRLYRSFLPVYYRRSYSRISQPRGHGQEHLFYGQEHLFYGSMAEKANRLPSTGSG